MIHVDVVGFTVSGQYISVSPHESIASEQVTVNRADDRAFIVVRSHASLISHSTVHAALSGQFNVASSHPPCQSA